MPSGESTQIYGVKSDIPLPSINELLPIGESDLDNALEWDSIPPVSHRRPESEFVYDSANVEKLRLLSLQRQQSSPEFNYINNNITLYEEGSKEKRLL